MPLTMPHLACLTKGVGSRGQNMVPEKELGRKPGEEGRSQDACDYLASVTAKLPLLL